jgi:hypothetical protein
MRFHILNTETGQFIPGITGHSALGVIYLDNAMRMQVNDNKTIHTVVKQNFEVFLALVNGLHDGGPELKICATIVYGFSKSVVRCNK